MAYDFGADCPSCGGELAVDIGAWHAKHIGPYKPECSIGHEGIAWNKVQDMYDEQEPPQEEPEEKAPSNHPASRQQFGQVINVDFKNKKRKE